MIKFKEGIEPNIRVGMVVQAYGFPILSGFKGENFYKVTRIEGQTVFFQRSNQDGQIGNIGLGEFSANIENVKDAIKSVESGTSTNGLRIWKETKIDEMIVSDKTDGRVKQMMLKIKSSYPSLNALNYDTSNKTYLFAFGKKNDADKLEKDFKAARSKNPNKAIGKFEFVRSADYPNDTPPTFVKQFKIYETIKEAGNMLVYNVNADAVTAFLRKYPKVRTVMTSIAKKNKDITKGYKEFLRFKDKHETELGGRGEIRKSDTFGEKQFYKYDWMGTTGWAEIYQFIHGAKVESVNEQKITVKKLNPITFYVEIDSKFGKSTVTTKTKEEAEKIKSKLEKAFKAGKINSTAAINHFAYNESVNEEAPIYKDWDEFVRPDHIIVYLKDGKKLKIAKNKMGGKVVYYAVLKAFNDNNYKVTNKIVNGMLNKLGENINEARGPKIIQREFDKVVSEIETTLDAYKKVKGTPKEKELVVKLKDLNTKKKNLAKELEDRISGLYKDAELKISEVQVVKGGKAEGLGLRGIAKIHNFDVNDLLQQFKKGVETEMEHTDNQNVAKEIALDHLVEDPLYYEKIQKIGL